MNATFILGGSNRFLDIASSPWGFGGGGLGHSDAERAGFGGARSAAPPEIRWNWRVDASGFAGAGLHLARAGPGFSGCGFLGFRSLELGASFFRTLKMVFFFCCCFGFPSRPERSSRL